MAEQEPTKEQLAALECKEDDETPTNYKAPAQKSLQEIQDLDKDDESLQKYKQTLLAGASNVNSNPNDPNVTLTEMTLVCNEAPNPLVLDLTGDLQAFKKDSFVLKEGVEYRIKISFKVNREIVSGLKYVQQSYRKGIRVDKSEYMVGSYGPKADHYEYITPVEEAPKGMMARGCYNIKSKFTDDDKHDHLSWEWNLNIKKDWKD